MDISFETEQRGNTPESVGVLQFQGTLLCSDYWLYRVFFFFNDVFNGSSAYVHSGYSSFLTPPKDMGGLATVN